MFKRMVDWLWGPPEARRMVQANFRSREAFIAAGRDYMLNPVTLYGYALPLTMLLTGSIKPEFTSLGVPEFASHLLTTAKVFAFWVFMWFMLGRALWIFLRFGISVAIVIAGLWIIAVVLSQIVTVLVVAGAEWSWMRIIRQAAFTLPSTMVAVYAAGAVLRDRLGYIPELVPIWWPNATVQVPLLLKLPLDKRARIRRIHAANQYVEVVTDAGSALLRLSLRDAVSLMPAETGWLCHRSLWIRKDEVVGLSFLRGQPQITDVNGETYSISRSSVPDIRDWLDSTRPAPLTDPPAGMRED